MLAAALAFGCAETDFPDDAEPFPKPSEDDVERLESSRETVYWLGRSHDGRELTYAKTAGRVRHTYLAYGEPDCDASSCSYPLEVTTSEARDVTGPTRCVRSFGRALMMACPGDLGPVRILTGDVIVTVDAGEDESLPLVRLLRLTREDEPGPLPPPDPFTCRELDRIPPSHVRRLPKRLLARCPG